MNYKLKKISDDASFREFYRIKKSNKTSIIIFAKKEKYKNLIVYSVINNILNFNKIRAPKLISSDYKNSVIEISDLGNKSFHDFIILIAFISSENIPRLSISLPSLMRYRS